MPSFISSSDLGSGVPSVRRTLLPALVIAVVCLLTWELIFRRCGYSPSIRDSEELWWSIRDSAHASDKSVLTFIGSSRSLLGISTNTIRERRTGALSLQLSLNGSSPLPILRHLADDETFAGTVV